MGNFIGKYGPLLIAEIGGNHEGDFEYAKRLAKLAIDSGVDYVKFQVYTGDTLVSQVESPDRNKHFKKFELSQEQHIELAEMVLAAGVKYTSSVWDLDAMVWLDKYISLYKIGSGDLTAYPVLRKTAELGKPIIISTGLSTEAEVLEAVSFIQSVNDIYRDPNYLAVLQCTSMYPIPNADANLSVMSRLKELTGLTIGYSDHTEGSKALMYSVAMGAEVLEFHFTDSREGKVFRDHKVSLTNPEIKELIAEIQEINSLKGSCTKQPVAIEIENGHVQSFRRAVYPARDIEAGEIFTTENLTVLRPNAGIDARDYEKLLGKSSATSLKKHQKLDWNLIS
ncbi:N-acetylneuraminate synthase family protein [Flavobacterium sp.]|uniref:N-acetylneuraminate synthase family protein n=1 Tax=Flavobacterium sp. TaxID=239 RepID=UPI002630E58E|nr:N-acetylneuraminate synthase family protein [Flavobacterium sp.]